MIPRLFYMLAIFASCVQAACPGPLAAVAEQLQVKPLRTLVCASDFKGVLPAERVAELQVGPAYRDNPNQLMLDLLPVARAYAVPPVSEFYVGAVALGRSGALYLGANLELTGSALGHTVHAEQSALNNALLHNEAGLARLAVTAPPCGHCRQFLNELDGADELEILVQGRAPVRLGQLLPHSFGPAALGEHGLGAHAAGRMCANAARCGRMNHSYAPYSGSRSAVEVHTQHQVYHGQYIENAAFNPSLSPLLSALDRMRFSERQWARVRLVTLVEQADARISQQASMQAMLQAIAPHAELEVRRVSLQ